MLLQAGADANFVSPYGSVLTLAAYNASFESVKAIVDAGADVNVMGVAGGVGYRTALLQASRYIRPRHPTHLPSPAAMRGPGQPHPPGDAAQRPGDPDAQSLRAPGGGGGRPAVRGGGEGRPPAGADVRVGPHPPPGLHEARALPQTHVQEGHYPPSNQHR